MKWEYKAIKIIKPIESEKGVDLANALNEMGQRGWELVQCNLDHNVFVFKRPKPLDIRVKGLLDSDVELRKAIRGYFGGKIG